MPIEVKDLSCSYNIGLPTETEALRSVSMTVGRGEIISVVGHTGSGKSTLAKHLNGLIIPQKGKVTVDGKKITNNRKELRKIREKVGLVFQYPEQQIFSETVREEIAFAPRNWGFSPDITKERVSAAADAVGLPRSLLEQNPFLLSGGQKRRVAIASVLSSNPDYIVFDEPTAGLDAQGTKEFIDILSAEAGKNKGIVHITHDIELALSVSTKILILSGGRSVVWGSPREVAECICTKDIVGMVIPDVLLISAKLKEAGKIERITWKPKELASMIQGAFIWH